MSNRHERENYLEVAERASTLAHMFRSHGTERTCATHERRYAEAMADQYEAIARINLEMAALAMRLDTAACH
jgi:hypothetical protein